MRMSPHQTPVCDSDVQSLARRVQIHNAHILSPPRSILPMFPSFNPSVTDRALPAPYHLSLAGPRRLLHHGHRGPFLGTREQFYSSRPHLHQREDPLSSSSSALVASPMTHRIASLQLPSPDMRLSSNSEPLSRLAAAKEALLRKRQKLEQLEDRVLSARSANRSANPPNQWSLPAGLVGDTQVFSSLPPILHPLPRSVSTSSVSSTSALSCAATVAKLALPFSKEEEGRIPLVGGPESFPMVLHRVLAELELVGGGRSIATFLPDGRSFNIKNQALFASQVLPVFFPKMKGFASFQRQLNLYDFRRIGGGGPDRGAYRHELFVRDCPAVSCRMKRTKIKGCRPRESLKS